ncbi:hypothetical protein GCM10022631_31320 [Deinococcus rubellus]|uniref:E3 binding domain-containing protein n=1 Tax=Deinococcus rubellus TaxID=1889240 RepID=A0ABY5YL64_9DEIO|nr:E3 binding domain-containing protein [Deinococcus rubellus]UWX64523.1 E3 binding domain-containing protein [Deinococcus rubellus]
METIAPLARVLAEANGIEWRSLHGTGEAGLITESDILAYLARVMSGEEDAPLTPVDPMPSPAELAAYSSPELLSRAGVEPELAEFLKAQQGQMQAAAQPVMPERIVAAPMPPEPVMAELEPELLAPLPEVEPVRTEPTQTAPIEVAPLEVEPVEIAAIETAPIEVEPAEVVAAEPEPVPLVAAEQTQDHGTPDHDEFELEDEAPMPPPTVPTAPARPAATGGLLSGLLSSLYRRNDAPKSQPAPVQPTPVQSTPVRPVPVQPTFTPPAIMPAALAQPPVPQPAEIQPPVSLPEVLPELEVAGPVYADVVPPISSDSSFDERLLPPAPVLGEVIEPETMPEVELPVLAEPQSVPTLPALQPYASSSVQPQVAAWSGTYLRRNTDLSALLSAREQLTELLGDLPLTLMVARAAQRHLGLLNLSSLAVANAQGQALSADLSGDLRGGIKALQDAQPSAALNGQVQADLLILDAGALDLDDLHYPHAVTLSLGRVVDGQAALSLNGDIDVQQGARFLAEVSALLGAPVKLLV